jgi:hypothetical protein
MKDLGQKLYNEKRYDFGSVYINQLMFKVESNEVLLVCKVIHDQTFHHATLCISFRHFNDLLLASHDGELRREISALIGEALSMDDQRKSQSTFQIDITKIFERPLRVRRCTYKTVLVSLQLPELNDSTDAAYVFMVRQLQFAKQLRT